MNFGKSVSKVSNSIKMLKFVLYESARLAIDRALVNLSAISINVQAVRSFTMNNSQECCPDVLTDSDLIYHQLCLIKGKSTQY